MIARGTLAVAVAALAAAGATAHAAETSLHTQPAVQRHATRPPQLETLLAAAIADALADSVRAHAHTPAAAPPRLDLSPLVRQLIAIGVAADHPTSAEADLARLYLAGSFRPDATLQLAWQPITRAAADYLGVAPGTVQREVGSGQTLAEIARERGRSPQRLRQIVIDASGPALDRAVAAGALTAAGEADILRLLQTQLR